MRELLAGATFVGEANIERDWSYSSSSFAGDGFVLVGDAACFVDPLFSSGVHLALGGATLAATYVRSALSNPASREQAAQAYQSVYESSTNTSTSPPSSSTAPTAAPTPTSGRPDASWVTTTRPRAQRSWKIVVDSHRRATSAP